MDCLAGLQQLPDQSVNTCVTSPPYWGLRDYGVKGQHGLEETPEEFIYKQVEVFREVYRVLKNDGTLWINIGDSYASNSRKRSEAQVTGGAITGKRHHVACKDQINKVTGELKRKDIVGIPWMLAFALRADGWYLRQDIIWSKPNPMPESVTDRCTKSHEYIFLLTKSEKYYFNQDAIKEPASNNTHERRARVVRGTKSNPDSKQNGIRPQKKPGGWDTADVRINSKLGRYPDTKAKHNISFDKSLESMPDTRNKRSVWSILPQAFPDAHFATFPEELPATCIKAGCPEGGIVLDPYMGAGTTALVARKLQRNFIGFELNLEYIKIAEKRLTKELGLFR